MKAELHFYPDDGCEAYPSCLNCPLPRCVYDEPQKRQLQRLRDEEVRELHQEGREVEALASQFGISRRTVYRILRGRE